jgi:hypothetical protein
MRYQRRTSFGWSSEAGSLWSRWVLASSVGAGLATALLFWPSGHIQGGTPWGEFQLFGPLLVFGPLLSAPQWLVLRRAVPRAGDWVVVTFASTFLAWIVGFPVGFMLFGVASSAWGTDVGASFAVTGAAAPAGALVGRGQASIIGPLTGRWVWVGVSAAGTTAGWGILGIAGVLVGGVGPPMTAIATTAGGIVGGAAYGVITGFVLTRLIWDRP